MNKNINILLHSIAIAESLLFSFQLLVFKNISSKSNKILGILMLFLALFLTSSIFVNIGLFKIAIYSNYLVMPLFLAINPFYYIYVKSLTKPNYIVSRKTIIHFIPSILILAFNLVFYTLLSDDLKLLFITKGIRSITNESVILNINILVDYGTLATYYIQLVSYVTLMIIMLKKHSGKIKNYFSYEHNVSLNWLKIFISIIIVNVILEMFIVVYSLYFPLPAIFIIIYYLILLFLINFLGYFGMKQTDIYIGNIRSSGQSNSHASIVTKDEVVAETGNKEENTEINSLHFAISEEEQKRIVSEVIILMETKKVFLNNKLSIYDIASDLKTNKSYISFSINNILKKNFRNFVNEYRIKEAQQLLIDPNYNNYSIEGIAQTVGYISKSTFNNSFQKFTGKKPSDFRNQSKLKADNVILQKSNT